ncbi:alpha/beta hydrolase [Arthrobacter bambusae]|uniref:Glutaredoxin-related protein n=1 Tax=Arthrobacter bambusae TaxID=1338426 RepID=A0AAW8DGE8_9MICC|nr:alpha/beta hydrolase [Arthrobacter bambusae]MDP9904284.1 glutaredoxin-related protein [Arthrobacter bambusae]MDQ0127720.1 glutaredoxin-related protein [Arthrobacter bambusae]MDQ0179063.1 glutaredoxin-related protein [Arthrobacter bambusae]
MIDTAEAVLHDGTTIPIAIHGNGRALMVPARFAPYPPEEAETMRRWGADPDLGPNLVNGLARSHRVIVADYESHRMAHPAPDTLTPRNVTADLLAIADAADAGSFAYYGYSWLALCGLQLAIRTDRLWALVMGGFPPLDGPYESMLAVTRAAHSMSTQSADVVPSPTADVEPGDWDSVPVQTNKAQTRQFVTLYEALQDFDDSAAEVQPGLPRLAFAGSDDLIDYGPAWGNVHVKIGEPLTTHKQELIDSGWDVQVLPGLDHIGAMRSSVVLPLLTDWLRKVG